MLNECCDITDKVLRLSERAISDAAPYFRRIDDIAQHNAEKVLLGFQRRRVSEACFAGTTGYGYNDAGRHVLDSVFSDVMGASAAIVRAGFVSGTHAIGAALFAALRPGKLLLSVTGTPYDTLRSVIGIAETGKIKGSLCDLGMAYEQIELGGNGSPNLKAIAYAVRNKAIAAVFVQRSRGYDTRRALSVPEIGEICDTVHGIDPDVAVIVDNCYGEFTDVHEPCDFGADLVAGSLIKNPGGGIAPSGGYVAGRMDLVEAAACRLTVPGIGAECGATLGVNRALFQGLFLAPHVVGQALKTSIFCARLFELIGYRTAPGYREPRHDVIQSIEFGSPELLGRFCKAIQASSPVDSHLTPIAAAMPGYGDPVIMAAGTFVQGSSIELSADGPMREPYCAYLQGGLTFESGKLGVMLAASYMEKAKIA